jgi:hypothetical protein
MASASVSTLVNVSLGEGDIEVPSSLGVNVKPASIAQM